MTQPQFFPLTADRSKVFFDENGKPNDWSKCPTCGQTSRFKVGSGSQGMTFTSLSCPHAFSAPRPS